MKKIVFLKLFSAAIIGIFIISSNMFAQEKKETKECKIQTSAYSWMCKNKIETNLKNIDGVIEADLDLTDKIVTIKYEPSKTNKEELKKIVEDCGYEASLMDTEKSEKPNAPGTKTSN